MDINWSLSLRVRTEPEACGKKSDRVIAIVRATDFGVDGPLSSLTRNK